MNILVLNGPNLNLLGLREPEIYGTGTYGDLCALLHKRAEEQNIRLRIFQSNHEGALVDAIQDAYGWADGIILNPAAYTHTSIALLDAIKAVGIPTVEVHLTDTTQREAFRQISYIRPACIAVIQGRGFEGYLDALALLTAGQE